MIIEPIQRLLSRAWLIDHGWEECSKYPMLFGSDYLDTDLCVVYNRKEYMVACFHHMGDKATLPDAMPSSVEVVGINNSVEMLDPSHSFLVVAASICGIGYIEEIQKALGGVYEITVYQRMINTEDKQ